MRPSDCSKLTRGLIGRPSASASPARCATQTLSQLAAALVIAAWTLPRLASAYARYLRFDHPRATALASQVIVVLLVWLVAIYA